jgi:hypothetical protein
MATSSLYGQHYGGLNKPRLTVFIAVDGLQAEHLALLWNFFERGGLKRLVGSGFYTPNGYCNYLPAGKAADYASLLTGTVPYYHGIVGEKIYSITHDDAVSIVADDNYHGIATDSGVSPKNLLATTVADELKLTSPHSKVYAIGLRAEETVMMAGHLADGAIWLDKNGRLASSDYYKLLPLWASDVNNTLMDNFLNSKWRPMYALHSYLFAPAEAVGTGTDYAFYTPSPTMSMADRVRNFRGTPYANTLIKDLAIRALKAESLGSDAATDMLCLQFSAQPVGQTTAEFAMAEKEDLYLNLDRDIRILLAAIDETVGAENTLFVLSGNQTERYSHTTLADKRINSGQFNARRAMALLNSYLMAKFGQGRWVSNYYARQITLNRGLIEKNRLHQADVEQCVVDFLLEFQGVHTAYTSSQIMAASGLPTDMPVRMRNSFFRHRSGDVVFTLLPGWVEVNDKGEHIGVAGCTDIYFPVAISGLKIIPNNTEPTVFISDIAPAICRIMQIPLPNGCIGRMIELNSAPEK